MKTTYASAEPLQHIDTVKGVSFTDESIETGVVPDVKGMGLIDAMYALENSGYRTTVKGRGKVISQSLAAGQHVEPGASIVIELE